MKKILFVVLFQSLLICGFGQEKTPTKAETMDWIGGKMKEHLAAPRQFISYSNGLFVYKKEFKAGVYCTSTVDLNKLTGMSDEYSSDFYVFGKILTHSVCPGDEYGTDYDYISISGPNYDDHSVPFDFNMDNMLLERMRKAFTTLMEYNAAKKGSDEAF